MVYLGTNFVWSILVVYFDAFLSSKYYQTFTTQDKKWIFLGVIFSPFNVECPKMVWDTLKILQQKLLQDF